MSRKVGFDYSSIPADKALIVQDHTKAIASALRHCSASVLKIGQRLIDVHEVIGRGSFQDWIRAEFAWSNGTASRYMACAKRFGDFEHAQYLQISAMILLVRRTTPQAAIDEALAIARSGSTVSKTSAELLIARHALNGSGRLTEEATESAAEIQPTRERQMWWLLQKKRVFVSAISRFSVELNNVVAATMTSDERKSLSSELIQLADSIRHTADAATAPESELSMA